MIRCGLYTVTNKITGTQYVGSSCDIFRRFGKHKWLLNKSTHPNPHFQNSWMKYGEDAFLFSVLMEVPKEILLTEEQKRLDVCKVNPHLYYNINYNAESPGLGKKMSDESKRKISLAMTGRKLSEETKRKMGDSKRGITLSEEHKQKSCKNLKSWPKGKKRYVASWNKGLCWSDETKKKMRNSKLGKISAFKGRKHSIESREKMRISAMNRCKEVVI